MGIGTIIEYFQSVGNTPVEREELKMRENGTEMAIDVDLSIFAEMVSGLVNLSAGMKERRLIISSGEQRSSGGQGKGGGDEGRWSERGGEDCIKTSRKEVLMNISFGLRGGTDLVLT